MGLTVGGLLDRGLKCVADVGAEVEHLVERKDIFFFGRERALVLRNIVGRLEVRNESQNAFRIFGILEIGALRIFLLRWSRRGGGLRLGACIPKQTYEINGGDKRSLIP